MPLIDNAVDGLGVGVLASVTTLVSTWLTRRSRRAQLNSAWKQQTDELTDRLTEDITRQLTRQFQGEIKYLRAQNERKEAEIRRLNVELNRQNRGGAHD